MVSSSLSELIMRLEKIDRTPYLKNPYDVVGREKLATDIEQVANELYQLAGKTRRMR